MDTLDEIEARGHGPHAHYLEYLRRFVFGAIELAPVENGTLGNQPFSFFGCTRAATRTSLLRPRLRRSSTTFDGNLTSCLGTGLLQCIRRTIAN
eukprot:1006884-Pyramimonas_sp.AAC.1